MVSDVFILILGIPPCLFSLFGVNLWFFKKTKRALHYYCSLGALIRGSESQKRREKFEGLYNQTITFFFLVIGWKVKMNYAMISLLITGQKELFLMEKLGCSSAIVVIMLSMSYFYCLWRINSKLKLLILLWYVLILNFFVWDICNVYYISAL